MRQTIPNSDDISPSDIHPGADLRYGDPRSAVLWNADLLNTILTGATLRYLNAGRRSDPVNLSHANLADANLSNAVLYAADLSGPNFSDAIRLED